MTEDIKTINLQEFLEISQSTKIEISQHDVDPKSENFGKTLVTDVINDTNYFVIAPEKVVGEIDKFKHMLIAKDEPMLKRESLLKQIKTITFNYIDDAQTKAIIAVMILNNGFLLTGISSTIDKSNFDIGIGLNISAENAILRLWELYGFHEKEVKYRKDQAGN